ncbi:MAG: apolipoprotein N-acyltransferase [Candidatus Omnitrophica bacterium]|nr:apolipoprotein N-acyltransferase [Candidatus Omnitrophota bacterium]
MKWLTLKDIGGITLSALFLTLAFHTSSFSFLAFIFLLPLLLVANSRKKAFFYFYFCGWLHYFLSLGWLASVSKLGFILLVFYFALFWGLFGYLSWCFFSPSSLFGLSFLWVVMEYMRSYLLLGGFPWLIIGYTQYRNLSFIQSADLLGAEFVSFLVIMANFLIFTLLLKIRQKRQVWYFSLVSSLLVLLVNFSYGLLRLHENFSSQGHLAVEVIQPAAPDSNSYIRRQQVVSDIIKLVKNTSPHHLVILPEAAFPFIVEDKYHLPLFALSRDIIVGALRQEADSIYNSLFLFKFRKSQLEIYDKHHLVPFGEYVPGRHLLRFIKALNEIENMRPGRDTRLLTYQKAKIGPLICFEDVFPLLVAREAERGANVFVNITDESWFGGKEEMVQHLQAAVFRAVEQRRFLIRSANTGISCIITPWGYIRNFSSRLKHINRRDVLTANIFLCSFPTLYSKIKDSFVWFSFAVVLLIVVRRRRGYGCRN